VAMAVYEKGVQLREGRGLEIVRYGSGRDEDGILTQQQSLDLVSLLRL